MCDTLRNTVRRGLSAVPAMRFRMRNLMRSRRSSFVLILISAIRNPGSEIPLGSGLSGLLLQHFTRVANALLLIRVGLAQAAEVGGDLADQLPIDARHRDVRLLVDGDIDPLGDVEDHRMRIAEREVNLLALHLRAVADADDVELLLPALGDAEHGIVDQAAREA